MATKYAYAPYPKFSIRLSQEELDMLQKKIDKLHAKLNKSRDPKEERAITKSKICLKALEIGLEAIQQKQSILQ